ncbi:MAG: spore coat protein U domain-containing protein [Acinetobacter sp.]
MSINIKMIYFVRDKSSIYSLCSWAVPCILLFLTSFVFSSQRAFAGVGTGSCWMGTSPSLNFGGTVNSKGAVSSSTVPIHCNQYNHTTTVYVTTCIYAGEGDPAIANNRRRLVNYGSSPSYLSYDLFYDAALSSKIYTTLQAATLQCTNKTFSVSENNKTVVIPLYGKIYSNQNVSAGVYRSNSIPIYVMWAFSSTNAPTAAEVVSTNTLQSNNFVVQASYENSCILASAQDLDFGSVIDLSRNITTSTQISLTCPVNTSYSIRIDGGVNSQNGIRRMSNGTDYINYELYQNAAMTDVWGINTDISQGGGNGSVQSYPIYGKIPVQSSKVSSGAYSDTVTVYLTY